MKLKEYGTEIRVGKLRRNTVKNKRGQSAQPRVKMFHALCFERDVGGYRLDVVIHSKLYLRIKLLSRRYGSVLIRRNGKAHNLFHNVMHEISNVICAHSSVFRLSQRKHIRCKIAKRTLDVFFKA